jgi:hypothetical protein
MTHETVTMRGRRWEFAQWIPEVPPKVMAATHASLSAI